jgi:LysM repeat protein
MNTEANPFWMKRAKVLTQALVVSGAVNIGLLGSFVYLNLKEKNALIQARAPAKKSEAALEDTMQKRLQAFSRATFGELLTHLQDCRHVEQGFTVRDLALACLVSFHHFNLEKAVFSPLLQKRCLPFTSQDQSQVLDIIAYPDLTQEQFDSILSYAKTEKWPLTSQGLFFELQRQGLACEASLLEAFCTTAEFACLATFFERCGLSFHKTLVMAFALEGSWQSLQAFYQQQIQSLDFSAERRREVLSGYFEQFHSTVAAVMLTQLDLDYVIKKLDDAKLILFLDKLASKGLIINNIAKEVLKSPRCDDLRKKAAEILYAAEQLPMPEPFDYHAALQKFCPEVTTVVELKPAATHLPINGPLDIPAPQQVEAKVRLHTIEKGDSLWKIAKKYKVTVEQIKKANNIDSDKLRLGKTLAIPPSAS